MARLRASELFCLYSEVAEHKSVFGSEAWAQCSGQSRSDV